MMNKYVKTNVPGPGLDKDKFSEQFVGCDCSEACKVDACSCLQLFGSAYDESGLLKVNILRELSSTPVLECGCTCSCDPKTCANRIVQQGINKMLYVFYTKDKGYGLMLDNKNNTGISSLNFVCEYAGEVIGDSEAKKRMKQTDTTAEANYLIALREHASGIETCTYIDPRYIGNVGRFINHSCDPNLFMVPVRANHQVPRLALFARKNIKPGEELTFDYSGNSTPNMFSEGIPKAESINAQMWPLCSETSNLSDISLYLMDNITQSSQLSESDVNPPKKRIKCKHDSNGLFENNHKIKKEGEVTVKLNKSVYATTARTTTYFDVNDPKTSMSSFVKRKPCFCGSQNCTGFLPLDNRLLCD